MLPTRRALAALLLAGFAAATTPVASAAPKPRTEVLFQAFPWDAAVNGQKHIWYRNLTTKARSLKAAGVTHVWYPPVSRSVAPQGYMPSDLYDLGAGDELGDNRTLYGDAAELKASVRAFREQGITAVADAVLNHRCASHQEGGVWNVFHPASGKAWWERWALAAGDYAGTGAPDSGADFAAAPDVDHANPKVRADLKAWLVWLRDEVGFGGVRFDFTKGYGAEYAAEYAAAMGASFSVGEYWTSMSYAGDQLLPDQDGHRQQLADWVDGTKGAVSTFDFTTKGLLQEALRSGDFHWLRGGDGRAGGFLGWWPAKAVTFVDNHDTGSTQAHWPFPGERVLAGYAYILTHPGVPTIFWDHFFEWGPDHQKMLTALSRLRHEVGVHRESALTILEARQGLYAATIDDTLAVKLGADSWDPGAPWKKRLAGPGFTVWSRR